MQKNVRPAVPGTNRQLMQLVTEHASSPPLSLAQRVSQLELILSKLGPADELKLRIQNLEKLTYNAKNTHTNGFDI